MLVVYPRCGPAPLEVDYARGSFGGGRTPTYWGCDGQKPHSGDGLAGEHTEADGAVAELPKEEPRNQTTGKVGAQRMSCGVPKAGTDLGAAAGRTVRAPAGGPAWVLYREFSQTLLMSGVRE